MEFFLYKSLKKPLTFFGLKDKYIYYAGGSVATGLIVVGILSNIIGIVGTLIGFSIAGGGIWYTYHIQEKKGLYNKNKNTGEIHIFPNRFKYHKRK